MDFLAPLMYDVSNIDMWKFKMSTYLKTLELHVYLATTKKSNFGSDKYIKANAQAMEELKHILSKEHLSLISYCNSAFIVWNTFTSPKEQVQHNLKRESRGDESE